MRWDTAVLSRQYSLAALSGVALALAFPAIDWNWSAWVALIPLLWVLEEVRPRAAFALGWTCGLFFYLSTLYWIAYTIATFTPVPDPLAIVPLLLLAAVLALYTGAFAAGVVFTARRGVEPALFAPVWWVALEWLRSWFPIGFPWVSLGYSQYRSHTLVQIAELTGVYGLSALIVLFNVVVASILGGRGTARTRGAQLAALTLVLVAVNQFGTWRLGDLAAREPTHHLRAAVVQGNIPQEQKWDPEYQDTTITTYERLSHDAAAAGQGLTLIVWPETAAPFFFADGGPLAERIRALARGLHVWLLFGSPAAEPRAGGGHELRNRAYVLSPDGLAAAQYDKTILVPFGEYVPLPQLLFFVDKLVAGVGIFGPGPDPKPIVLDGHRVGVLICYEAIFPWLARTQAADGADLLINITNDAWFGPTSAPYQHLAMAALRAVENRVPVLRAANTGVSAVVRPDGSIEAATPLFEATYRVVELSWPATETVYTRYGDVFAVICVLCSSAVLIACARTKYGC